MTPELHTPADGGRQSRASNVVIIGGASGIGLATTRHFLSAGMAATMVDADADRLEVAANGLTAYGDRLSAFAGDVRRRPTLEAAFAQAAARHGAIDILVYTAGVLLPAPLAEISEDHFDLTFDVNTKGFWNCVQAALAHFPDRGGAIIAVSSASGQRPKAGNGVYAASKVALQFLVRSFALELTERRIRVNCVSPSTLSTPMTERLAPAAATGFRPSPAPPLGRLCQVEDIARSISFLCSEDAAFITGANLAVDGGLTAGIALC